MTASPEQLIRERVDTIASLVLRLAERDLVDAMVDAATALADRLKAGGKVLACGNGGSAALAQHFVAELIGRYELEREGIAGLALGSNVAALTAVSNDYDYSDSFARETKALGSRGDVVVGFSTSGRSPNILAALEAGRSVGAETIAVVGGDSSTIAPIVDHCIAVPTGHIPRVQELHGVICHVLCEIVEAEIVAARNG